MSIEAMAWALNAPLGGNQKVVLLGLANHAHKDGSEAHPALDTLAHYAHCDRSTARRNVRKLVELGFAIEDGLGPKGQTNYRLPINDAYPGGVQNATGGKEGQGGVASEPLGGGIAVPPEPSFNRPVNRPSESARARASGDDLLRVWEHYQRVMPSGRRFKLDPQRRLVIQQALKVRSVEECCAAIDGLAQSEYHVQGAYTDIRYALKGGGRAPSPEATIDRMGAIARGSGNGNGGGGVVKRELPGGGTGHFNGRGERVFFDHRSWSQLSKNEQDSAREMMEMGVDPAER